MSRRLRCGQSNWLRQSEPTPVASWTGAPHSQAWFPWSSPKRPTVPANKLSDRTNHWKDTHTRAIHAWCQVLAGDGDGLRLPRLRHDADVGLRRLPLAEDPL